MCFDPLVKIIISIQTSFALQKCTKFVAHLRWGNPEDHNLQAKNFEKFERKREYFYSVDQLNMASSQRAISLDSLK